jgi:hypothetical protein
VERRIAEAQRGLEGDPAVEARKQAVEAALARERSEPALDELELRVRGEREQRGGELALRARVPVPDPGQVRARRAVRRAETETSLARLDETSLSQRAERCFRSTAIHAHQEHSAIYQAYARREKILLEWNQEWRRSGIQSERIGAQFDLEGRIKLVARKPGPPPESGAVTDALPPVGRGPGALVTSEDLLFETVRRQHPSVAVHRAVAAHYEALSARSESTARPSLKFVDFDYMPIGAGNDDNAFGAQLAFQIPFGTESRADASRYRALRRSEALEGERLVQQQVRRSLFALREFEHFESNMDRWQELLELARDAEELADRWRDERLARPSQVENLIDRAYDARVAVIEARERAGLARCTVLALTGVSLDDWPRE